MRARAPSLVYDVSGLVRRAQKRPTGIERVLLEIALALIDDGGDGVSFCRYDSDRRVFVEVPVSVVRERAASMRGTASNSAPSLATSERKEPSTKGCRRAVARSMIPWPEVTRHLLCALAHVRRSVVEAWLALRAAAKDVAGGGRRGSAGFVGLWSNETMYCAIDFTFAESDLDDLRELKAERGFRVALMVHDLIPFILPQYFSWSLHRTY